MSSFSAPSCQPYIQLRPQCAVLYNKFTSFKSSSLFDLNAKKLAQRKKYTGELTAGAIKRMSRAINVLIESTPQRKIFNSVSKRYNLHRISFITLTMPASKIITNSKEPKKLLEKLLRWLRSKNNMRSYVWKAEVQKNGQIHFHITSDVFVNCFELRNYWNLILFKSGLFDDYFKNRGDFDVNSTDIKEVKNVKNLAAYLIKYFCKTYQNEAVFKGKVWDCSLNLKKATLFSFEAFPDDIVKLQLAAAQGVIKEYVTEHCCIYSNFKSSIYKFIDSWVLAKKNEYYRLIYDSGGS